MKNSCIGGQAVIEGVMMKNKNQYAVSVRLPDKSIITDVQSCTSIVEKYKFLGLPFIRGSVNLIESMIIGMKTLSFSANFFDEEEGKKDDNTQTASKEYDVGTHYDKAREEAGFMTGWVMFGTIAFSLVLSALIFMFLPQLISEGICKLLSFEIGGPFGAFIEGVIRLAIFILYIKLITFMPDIKRTFMYHGAEHKSINCLEHGLPLTVENVRNSSKEHKRCGTSFTIIVLLIAIVVFMFIPPVTAYHRIVNFLVRFVIRLLLLPVIAGISYEFLRLAGKSENKLVNILSKPGMWMQGLTTREPDDSMIEVAIASVEAVFDWKQFLKDNFEEYKDKDI